MFCNRCGTELPDNSQFCLKCGNTLPATASTPTPTATGTGAATARATVPVPARSTPKPSRYIGTAVLALILVGVVWWTISSQKQNSLPNASPSVQLRQLSPVPHTQPIVNTAFTVNASSGLYYKFLVPQGAYNVTVDGRLSATGGSGNDIEAYLLNEDEFVNWQNGHSTSTYFSSGRVTQGSINAQLPSGAGTYYVVFNNKFSLLTPKAVQASVLLHYTTPPSQQ